MKREEVLTILGIMKVAYPNFYKDLKKDEAENTINLWAQMFEEEHSKVVIEAVKALICTNKFPPTIADVKEKIRIITTKEEIMTEQEAWQQVRKAISCSYYGSVDAFNNLKPILKKLVGSPNQLREWAVADINELETVIKSNFSRSYTAKVKKIEQYESLPESTKALIETFSEKYKMIEG